MKRRLISLPPILLWVALVGGCMQPFDPPEVDSEDGKLFIRRCSLCHALPNPERMSFDKWEPILERMARNICASNVPPLPQDEFDRILSYIKRHAQQPDI